MQLSKERIEKLERKTIQVFKADRETLVETKAIIAGPFAVTVAIESNHRQFVITHLNSTAALSPHIGNLTEAIRTLIMLDDTLSDVQKEAIGKLTIDNGTKNKTLKAVYKWLKAYVKCVNNIELEKMVGCFYQDRAAAEKLRIKINPENKKLLDDQALYSESIVKDAMAGKIEL